MKIALIGSAPSSVAQGPYRDKSYAQYLGGKPVIQPPAPHLEEEWEIWACSPGAFGVVPRATRWFEVHRWEPGRVWFSPEYCQFLREFKGPVYTGGVIPEIVNHVVYPIDRVEAEFTSYFLSSSLSLMLALAILEIQDLRLREPEHDHSQDVIGLWGVDMAATEEYFHQRSGCHFFLLEALKRGISVYVPPESDLLRPMPVYGISEWDHQYIKLTARAREINARLKQNQEQVQQLQNQIMGDVGALSDLDYMVKTWASPFNGIPHGMVIRLEPGTGLGGSVVRIDGKPRESTDCAVDWDAYRIDPTPGPPRGNGEARGHAR